MRGIHRLITAFRNGGEKERTKINALLESSPKLRKAMSKLPMEYRDGINTVPTTTSKRSAQGLLRNGNKQFLKKKMVLELVDGVDKKLKAKKNLNKTEMAIIRKMKAIGILGNARAKHLRNYYGPDGKVK